MQEHEGLADADIVVVGAGAAGLMAGIFAARSAPGCSVLILDGAKRVGAKILAAGGGRCNVTHHQVTPEDYSGSSRNSVRKVLGRFDVERTIAFFRTLGVELKREDTGKLFPVTDRARTVLQALLDAAEHSGARLMNPRRIDTVEPERDGFRLRGEWGSVWSRRVILATGGKSLPSTGSDGHGYAIARSLGHSLTPKIFPALVPLVLAQEHFVRALSGLTLVTGLEVRSTHGKRLAGFRNSTLCTHFGLSGPCALDISRHLTAARIEDPGAELWIDWLPDLGSEGLDAALQALGAGSPLGFLRERMPERLALALCAEAGLDPRQPGHKLGREDRRALVRAVCSMRLPVVGDKGYGVAEVTAGGVPLAELQLDTLESRMRSGLHLCGEICDVDGRIGGFNFQWAWASGHIAGTAAAKLLPALPPA